jgi:hypothetical protein
VKGEAAQAAAIAVAKSAGPHILEVGWLVPGAGIEPALTLR